MAQTFTAWLRAPGLTSTALTLAIVLGSAALSAILVLLAITTADTSDTFPTTFSMLPLLMGWSLGGQLTVEASVFIVQGSMAVTALPLGTLTAAGIGVYWLARRRAGIDGSAAHIGPVMARAGVEALAVSLAACLVTAPFSVSARIPDLGQASISSSPFMMIVLVTVAVFVALTLARGGSLLSQRLPGRLVQVGRELVAMSQAVGVVLGVVVGLGYIWVALTGDSKIASLLLLPLFLPNLILAALVLGSLGALTGTGTSGGALTGDLVSQGMDQADNIYAWKALGGMSVVLFIAIAVAVAVAAARVGVRRGRVARIPWQRTWQLPVAVLIAGIVVFYGLLPLRFSGSAAGESISLSLRPTAWTFLTVGVVAAIVSVLAEVLPRWLYSAFPAVLPLAAGKQATSAWLAGTSGTYDGTVTPQQTPQWTPQWTSQPQWVYTADPVTGASLARDTSSGATFAMDAATGQWVRTAPSSAPGIGGVAPSAPYSAIGVLPEPAPMSAASRRRLTMGLIAAGAVVVLVVAGVVALNVVNSMRGPDKEVRAYLALLSDGKAAEATKMVDPGVPNDQRTLLTDQALGAATARVEVVKIDKPTISGDTATIPTRLSLDGKAFDYTFTATKESGSFGLTTWKVNKALVVSVGFSSSVLPGVKVGGVSVDLSEEKDSYSLLNHATQYVYPGVYPLAAPDSISEYLSTKDSSLKLTPSGVNRSSSYGSAGNDLQIKSQPTDELKTKVLDKVKEQTKACTVAPTNEDKSCPWEVRNDLGSASVDKDATKVEFSELDDLSFKSDEINISATPKPSTWNQNPTAKKTKFVFTGKVEVSQDAAEPTITIESSSTVY